MQDFYLQKRYTIFTWKPFSPDVMLRVGSSYTGIISHCCGPGCNSYRPKNRESDKLLSD